MNKRKMLAQQRRILLAQSAVQRELLANQVRTLMRPLSWIDKGLTLIQHVKKPVMLAGFIFSLFTLKSQGLPPLISKSFMVWQTARRLMPTVREMVARFRA